MERAVEEFEQQCWRQIQTILKEEECLGIEYDENVICDVCRSVSAKEACFFLITVGLPFEELPLS